VFKNSSNLIAAVSAGDLAQVKQLLASGAEPRSRDAEAWTALHIAASRGYDDIAVALLDGGADVNAVAPTTELIDRTRYEGTATPLMMALRCEHSATTLLLIERGADLAHEDEFSGEDALFMAAKQGNLAVVARLLRDGLPKGRSGYYHQSAITAALVKSHVEVGSLLLSKGYRPDANSLQIACRNGFLQLLPTLVAAGADVNDPKADQTAVVAAASSGHIAVLEWLAAHGADLASQASSAMPGAGRSGQIEALRWLITQGADIDAQTYYGWTALTSAAWNGHVECVAMLLSRGANDGIRDTKNKTALDWAKEAKHDEVVRLLTAERV
jgi:ankyrin repeat protein